VGEAIQSLIVDGSRNIVLDLSSVSRVDSSGLGTLVGNSKAISSIGGTLCLAGASEGLRRVLQVTNLAKYFSIHMSVDEAVEGLEACTVGQVPSWVGGS
jgi:anti-anti-sigma factor